MSIDPRLTTIPGYDAAQYATLLAQAETHGVDQTQVDALLLSAIENGKSFSQAVDFVAAKIPTLKAPTTFSLAALGEWKAVPAPGTLIMAILTEVTAQNRRQNKDLMWAQSEAIAASMKEAAQNMKDNAVLQFGLSMAAAVVAGAGGVMGGGMTASGAILGAVSKGFDSGAAFAQTMGQANQKIMEADQERMRAMRESLKDLNDGLKELIQKSLSGADNIQQGRNQAMTRILA